MAGWRIWLMVAPYFERRKYYFSSYIIFMASSIFHYVVDDAIFMLWLLRCNFGSEADKLTSEIKINQLNQNVRATVKLHLIIQAWWKEWTFKMQQNFKPNFVNIYLFYNYWSPLLSKINTAHITVQNSCHIVIFFIIRHKTQILKRDITLNWKSK